MKSKNISLKDIDVLKHVYTEFNIKDSETLVDLFCIIKQFDDNLHPKDIRKLFTIEFDSDFYKKNKDYISKYNDTNYFGIIRRKYEKKGIVSLFRHQIDFLDAFLQRYPTPQDVNLPFWNWNIEIIQHYIEIEYNRHFPEYFLKKALNSIPEYNTNPFFSSCRNYIYSKKFHPFVWNIKFIKSTKKYTHYIPIRFDCRNMETNSNSLKFYSVNTHDQIPQKIDNIFSLLRRCIPTNISANECIFLIIKSNYKETYFTKEFLALNDTDLLKTKFVFISLRDIKTLYQTLSCSYLNDFYISYSPCHKSIKNYVSSHSMDDNYIRGLQRCINLSFP